MRRRDGMSPQTKSKGPLIPKAAPPPPSRAPFQKGSPRGHFWGILCRLFRLLPPPPASLSVSLSPGRPSPGALSHLPPPRSRKPVLTCWPTSAETPLLLPRWHQLLLHSQPLGARRLPMGALPTSMPLAVALALLHLEACLQPAKPRSRPSQHPQEGSRSAVRTDVWGRPVTDTLSLLPTYLPFPCPTLTASQSDATWKSQLRTPCFTSCACPGSSQGTPFAASPLAPASQPNSLADMGSLLGPGASAGGIPSSIFGMASQVPTLQSATTGGGGSTGLSFGAFNPFTTPAAHAQLPSTNPFQPNGLATGPGFGMSGAGPGFPQTVPPTGAFSSPFPPPLFPPSTSVTQQQNGSSFGDQGSAKLGQRPLSQPAGISTNPFMTGSSSSPFACNPPNTNPFL
ncbi:arf-GAP domain and FG repeat-containing protein 2 isoform 3-T5 [Megaptera novaeangliae]